MSILSMNLPRTISTPFISEYIGAIPLTVMLSMDSFLNVMVELESTLGLISSTTGAKRSL